MKNKKILAIITALVLCVAAAISVPVITSVMGGTGEKTIDVTFPNNDQTVYMVKPSVANYVEAMRKQAEGITNDYVINDLNGDNVKIADYCRLEFNDGQSKDIVLAFDAQNFAKDTVFTVKIADNAQFDNAKVMTTKDSFVTVNNLYLDKTYYWKVEEKSSGVSSAVSTFRTNDYVRMITVQSSAYTITNVRDFGGRMTESGRRVKQGIIFRGSEFIAEQYTKSSGTHYKNLDDTIISIVKNDLGIAYEVDLRGFEEANQITASYLGEGVDYMRVTNGAGGGYASLWNNTGKDAETDDLNGNVKNKVLLKKLFAEVFTNANEKHVYFHCWGGADRTGTIAFLLGGLLGMSYTDLVMDYEFTSFAYNYRPHDENDPKGVYTFPKMIEAIKASGYYEEGKKLSDVIKDWMINELDMTAAQVETLKNNLLE